MALPQVSVYVAVSLDGFIACEDGRLDWLDRVQDPHGGDYGYATFMSSVDAVVMGRNTYDTVLGFGEWPFAGKYVIVLTHRPIDSKQGESAHSGALRPLIEQLGGLSVRRIYLDGGHAIRQGLAERLVDDLTLSWIPVLLGQGRSLFAGGIPESDWKLVKARQYPKGLAQVEYQRVN